MKKTVFFQVRIEPEKLAALDEKLQADGYSNRAEWFNELLRKYLKGADNNDKN